MTRAHHEVIFMSQFQDARRSPAFYPMTTMYLGAVMASYLLACGAGAVLAAGAGLGLIALVLLVNGALHDLKRAHDVLIRQPEQARQYLPAPHADVVRDDPVHIFTCPARLVPIWRMPQAPQQHAQRQHGQQPPGPHE